jgi:hypothetical protein
MKKDQSTRGLIVKIEIESKKISYPLFFSLNCESLVSLENTVAIQTAMRSLKKEYPSKNFT